MVNTLKEVSQLQKTMEEIVREGRTPPYSVSVVREVSYYAYIDGIRYALYNDWETQCVTEYIDKYFNKTGTKKTPNKTNSSDVREAFEAWFLSSAKAPIDPWHKEFAWSVWQAAYNHKPAIVYDEVAAERDRYKSALEKIIDQHNRSEDVIRQNWKIGELAKQALNNTKE